ncbi:MAG: ATP-binding protein, partial [Treponema sp.]|nr:ATP-binding protein [Treponema sp.]
DFGKIREGGFLYVDKTARIHELLTGSGGIFFLSRPRRFGKSLLCSTLGALFEGRRELFGPIAGQPSLAIDVLDWEWKQHPVIRIDLNAGDYEKGTDELLVTIKRMLELCAGKHDVPFAGETLSDIFARLIFSLHEKYKEKVIVIVDEYDKPLLTTIDVPDIHKEIRNALKAFYGVLKSSDEYLRMAFLTGVTKFSQVSVFSDLNNITDISFAPRFNDLCGITQEELERDFAADIAAVLKEKHGDRHSYLAEVKRFYNGYRFSEKPETLYNPFGLLNHFNELGKFGVYWFATGTPAFLVTLIENQKIDILRLEKTSLTFAGLQKFNVDNMDALAVLYQSGYLTIVDYDEEFGIYTLDYPNEEVRSAFAEALLEQYVRVPAQDVNAMVVKLPKALSKGDIEGALQMLPPFFASIPYDIQIKDERYYQTVIHLLFRMLGLYCRSEVRIAAGRIDTLVETKQYVYCFEFKLNGAAEEALTQIDSKDYLLPWEGSGKGLVKVGVSFDYEKRNIGEWKTARVADSSGTLLA